MERAKKTKRKKKRILNICIYVYVCMLNPI